MQVQLSGQHIEITPALRSHVQSKLDRLERLYDNITSLAVVLSIEKLEQCADGTLAVGGNIFHAQATDGDMYASIDILIEKLVVQLRKHKEKRCDHHQREGREANYG